MKNKKLLVFLSASFLIIGFTFLVSSSKGSKQNYTPRKSSKIELSRGIQGALEYLSKLRGDAITGEIKTEDVLFARFLAEKYAKYKVGNPLGLTWEEMGPDNVGGRTRAILIDKRDATSNTLYAGGVSGGLWKSTNGGSTWSKVTLYNQNGSVDNTNLAISCIAQAPNGTIFVGTGEGLAMFSGHNQNTGQPGGGIYRCTSGDDFRLIPSTIPNVGSTSGWAEVNRIAVNPISGIVYAAVGNALKFSTDNGTTWKNAREQITSTNTIEIQSKGFDVKTAPDGTVVAVAGNKIYVSNDTIFLKKNITGLTVTLNSFNDRIEIAVAPSNSNYIYAVVAKGGALHNIYRTTDKGDNWTVIAPGGSTSFNLFGDNNQGWYDNVIAVFPNNPKKIIIAGINCWKGEEFVPGAFYDLVQITSPNETISYNDPTPNPNYAHVDHHTCVFHPTNPNIFYLGNDGGINRTNDGGLNFVTLNRFYSITQFYGLGVGADGSVLGGTQDNSNPYIDRGTTTPYPNSAKVLWSGDGGWAAISNITTSLPVKQKALFVTAQYASMGRSYDNGNTWQSKNSFFAPAMTGLQAAFVTPMLLWQTVNNTQLKDSVTFVADKKYFAGQTITVKSKQLNYPFSYTLTSNLDSLASIRVLDKAQSRFFLGAYEAIWMTPEPLNFSKKPAWFKIANFPGEVVLTMANSKDGNYLFVSTGSKLYRVSNLINSPDSASLSVDANGYSLSVDMIKSFNSNRTITSIAVDPRNPDYIVVTLGNYGNTDYVYASNNATSANPVFVNKTGSGLPTAPVYASLIEANNSNVVILGTEFGIYTCGNFNFNNLSSTVEWAYDNNGMERVPVFQLRQQTLDFGTTSYVVNDNGNVITTIYPGVTNTGVIYAATHGRGFWQCKNYVGINSQPITQKQDKINLSVSPNPVLNDATFKLTLSKDNNVIINIYDIKGNLISSNNYGKKTAGEHQINFNADNLKKGTYIIHMISGDDKVTTKFIKM